MRLKTVFKSGILAFLGGGLLLAYATYKATDTSLNTVGGTTQNWMGKVGAYLADNLMQWMGSMGWVLIISLLAWSVGVWFGKKVKIRLWLLVPTLILGCLVTGAKGGVFGVWMSSIPYTDAWGMRCLMSVLLMVALTYKDKDIEVEIPLWCR